MNLFAQLAQQTLGETPASITPRLAARFESAGVPTALAAETSEGLASADEVQSTASQARGIAGEERSTASETHILVPAIRQDTQVLQAGTARFQTDDMGTAPPPVQQEINMSVRREQASMLRQPTIEPHVARTTANDATRATSAHSAATIAPALRQPPATTSSVLQEPAPAPMIQVSIGRVEVRAVMRPQEPPCRERETPRAPSQTLDDYLRKGRGGQ